MKESYSKYLYFLILLILVIMVPGCRHSADPSLLHAESIMEEHPDSALMILEAYSFPEDMSDLDRALHGMLLTHARYKNFIDETNDSLINASVDYFLEHHDMKRAPKALFLAGMIRMNAEKLGEAAVSFNKGLDIARDNKAYFWEGQCERGLSILYERLDGSSQVKYAKQAYDSFLKSGYQDWINYSKLDLARAYHNHEDYEKSLELIDELINLAVAEKDTLILSESLQLKGLTFAVEGNNKKSLENYVRAYNINPLVLTDNDKRHIQVALNSIQDNSLPDSIMLVLDKLKIKEGREEAFFVLAYQGRYKDAYESLERYKNMQDSAISLIYRNNIAESVNSYDLMTNRLKEEKVKTERMFYWIVILLAIVICIVIFLRYRETLHKEKETQLKTIADMESLRADLMAQIEKANIAKVNTSDEKVSERTDLFERIIKQRYAEVNALCDDYYQFRFTKKENDDMLNEIKKIMKDFTEKSGLGRVEQYVDENSEGLYSSFRKDFFYLSEDNRRLFLYLMLGFNARTISVIIEHDISAVYNKKSRLKAKIIAGE